MGSLEAKARSFNSENVCEPISHAAHRRHCFNRRSIRGPAMPPPIEEDEEEVVHVSHICIFHT